MRQNLSWPSQTKCIWARSSIIADGVVLKVVALAHAPSADSVAKARTFFLNRCRDRPPCRGNRMRGRRSLSVFARDFRAAAPAPIAPDQSPVSEKTTTACNWVKLDRRWSGNLRTDG